MAVDDNGAIHVAAVGNAGIWYLTNKTGQWVLTRVTTAPFDSQNGFGLDGQPSIAVDADASAWIAYARWQCAQCDAPSEGVFYVTDSAGKWSQPVKAAESGSVEPSLAVKDGHLLLAYAQLPLPAPPSPSPAAPSSPPPCPIWYASDAGGKWSNQRLTTDGSVPDLRLDGGGLVHIVYAARGCQSNSGLEYATHTSSGAFVSESIPGADGARDPRVDFDPAGNPSVAWWYLGDDGGQTGFFASRGTDGWAAVTQVTGAGAIVGFVLDRTGVAHIVTRGDAGLLYSTNESGPFASSSIVPDVYEAAMSLDKSGQPLVVYPNEGPDGKAALWLVRLVNQ